MNGQLIEDLLLLFRFYDEYFVAICYQLKVHLFLIMWELLNVKKFLIILGFTNLFIYKTEYSSVNRHSLK